MANNNKKASKKYSRSKKFDTKKSSEESKDFRDGKPSAKDCNDMSWLFPDPNIMDNVCNFSIQSILGLPVELTATFDGGAEELHELHPSVMGIRLFPSPGIQREGDIGLSGLNQEGRRAYNLYSMVSNRTTQYQPQDIELAILSVGQLLVLTCTAIKILGLAFTYNQRNRTVPRLLIKAMNCDPDSVLGSDLAGLRDEFNQIMMACNSIMMPDNIKYFDECKQWFGNYFVDSESLLGQYYITYPGGYWYLDETGGQGEEDETGEQGGELKFKGIIENDPTYTSDISYMSEYKFRNLLDSIIDVRDRLLTSSLMQKVFTDTVKYASEKGGNLVGFGTVPSQYIITPMYNQEFLHIIHNASTIGVPTKASMNVTQSVTGNRLLHEPKWTNKPEFHLLDVAYVDFQFTDTPGAKEKGQSLLWKVIPTEVAVDPDHEGKYMFNVDQLPVFYPTVFTIWKTEEDYTEITTTHRIMSADEEEVIATMEKFRDHPLIYMYDSDTRMYRYITGDLNFYDVVNYRKIKFFWDSAYLGLFNVIDKFGSIETKGHD